MGCFFSGIFGNRAEQERRDKENRLRSVRLNIKGGVRHIIYTEEDREDITKILNEEGYRWATEAKKNKLHQRRTIYKKRKPSNAIIGADHV